MVATANQSSIIEGKKWWYRGRPRTTARTVAGAAATTTTTQVGRPRADGSAPVDIGVTLADAPADTVEALVSTGDAVGILRTVRAIRVVVAVVAIGLAGGIVANLAARPLRSLPRISDERTGYVESPTEGLTGSLWPVGHVADALKALRPLVHKGDQLWISDVDPNDDPAAFLLVSEYFLYPAVVVTDADDADVAIIVGGDTAARPTGFSTLIDKDGLWAGRRNA